MHTKYPLLRLFISYAIGLLLSSQNYIAIDPVFLEIFCVVAFVFLFWFTRKNDFKVLKKLTLVWYILFLITGLLNTSVRDSVQVFGNSNHYFLKVLERPIEKQRSYSAKAKILSNDEISFAPTYTLVYFEKSPNVKELLPGDLIEAFSKPSEVEGSKNPKEFDYKAYLELLNIHSRFYLKQDKWLIVKKESGLRRASTIIQYHFSTIIQSFGFPEKETAVLQALLIGNRIALSDELTESYASAGAMHVLAVSGLHVGILMLVLINISKPLILLKHGRFIQGCVVVLGIWSYAFITGLSPSVLRAATMFTFIYLGRFAKRDVGIYNALLASAFFLLILQPNLIFQVGFQLSYAAVLGILFIQPKLYGLIAKPRNVLLDRAWVITCVSFAAQIATFPFSIYYFHQFPLLFLFSNLVVIIVTYLIMVVGLLFLVLGATGMFNPILFQPLYWLVWIMNYSVEKIQDIPNSVVFELSINRVELVLLYLIIVFMSVGLAQKSFKLFSSALAILIVFSVFNVWENRHLEKSSELTFYSVGRNTVIEFRQGKEAVLFGDSVFLSNTSKMQFHVMHNLWSQNLKTVKQVYVESEHEIGSSYLYRDKIIFIDALNIRLLDRNSQINEFRRNEIVLLTSNHEIEKGAKQVIVTASVSRSVKEKWKEHYQDSFVDLADGYYSIPLNGNEN